MALTTLRMNLQSLHKTGTLNITRPAHTSQSNGKAESVVKVAPWLKKADKDSKDIYQAILEWCSSPTPESNTAPVQRLTSRHTRSSLPCKNTLYHPRVVEDVMKALVERQRASKKNFDGSAKPLPALVVEQPVRTKTQRKDNNSPWVPGRIAAQLALRSSLVQVNDTRYRRNRIHYVTHMLNQLKAMLLPQWSSLSRSMNSVNQHLPAQTKDLTPPGFHLFNPKVRL